MLNFIEKLGAFFKKDESSKKEIKIISNPKKERSKNFNKTAKKVLTKKIEKPLRPLTEKRIEVAEPKEGMVRFTDLDISNKILEALNENNYKYCTTLQAKLLPRLLDRKDLVAKCFNGNGKTSTYLISLFENILRVDIGDKKLKHPRGLIIVPNKEIAFEVYNEAKLLNKYSDLSIMLVAYGSDFARLKQRLSKYNIDLIIATPKELYSLYKTNDVIFDNIETVILDEAVRLMHPFSVNIFKDIMNLLPKNRQTIVFSTIYKNDLSQLIKTYTRNVVQYGMNSEGIDFDNIEQKIFDVSENEKNILLKNLIKEFQLKNLAVFIDKDKIKNLIDYLNGNEISTEIIKLENSEELQKITISPFESDEKKIIILDDELISKIDIKNLVYIVNFNLPEKPFSYLKRISKLGKTLQKGIAITFATENDVEYFQYVEKYIRRKINFIKPDLELIQETVD